MSHVRREMELRDGFSESIFVVLSIPTNISSNFPDEAAVFNIFRQVYPSPHEGQLITSHNENKWVVFATSALLSSGASSIC